MNQITAQLVAAGYTPPTTDTAIKAPVTAKPKVKIKKNRQSRRMGKLGHSGVPAMFEWSHPELGKIQIGLRRYRFIGDAPSTRGANTWWQIDTSRDRQPRRIELETLLDLNKDVEVAFAHAGNWKEIGEDGEVPLFTAEIQWKPNPKDKRRDAEPVPSFSHGKDEDFQLYIWKPSTGFGVHLDVSAVSRKGGFWATLQEVTGMQAFWHPAENDIEGLTSVVIGDRGYSLVPVYAECSYEGFDPVASIERTYKGRTEWLMGLIAKWGAAVHMDDVQPGEWKPEWPTREYPELKTQGYDAGVVLWYNLTMGGGVIQLESGTMCWVHFTTIENWNGKKVADGETFPILEPMKGVYVQHEPPAPGKTMNKVTRVRTAA